MAATYRLSLWRRGVNALVRALLEWGLGPRHTYLLTVRGRKTGRLYSTPVTLGDMAKSNTCFSHEPRADSTPLPDCTASKAILKLSGV